MTIIRDQRQMSGPAIHDTPEQIEAFWEEYAEKQRERGREFELTKSRKKLTAYVSDSRWVADCRECLGGIALWPDNPKACCLSCGTIYSLIDWPDDDEIGAAEQVLAARERDGERNWMRQQGEDVADLKAENLLRGVPLKPGP